MKSKPPENHSSHSHGFDRSFTQTAMNYRNPQTLMRLFWCLPQTEKNLWQAPEKHDLDNNMPFEAPSSPSYRVLASLEGIIPGTQ